MKTKLGVTPPANLTASFGNFTVETTLNNLSPGFAFHFRAFATNESGATASPDLAVTLPPLNSPGDLNGDGMVDQGELDLVLSNYWPTSPWLYITNTAGLGSSNVTFALSNSTAGAYSVLMSTNLVDWDYLGPATPLYQFFDTNAPVLPQRYYRLRWP